MAERRMFAKTIIDSDAFLDMPLSSQSLYFHLSMRADDDGFINNARKIQRMIGASDDDLRVLIGKRFIIPFESGIVVIKHWRIHNYIQKDRYTPTVYEEEKALLSLKDNKAYTLEEPLDTGCIQDVSNLDAQVRIGKVRECKDSIDIAPAPAHVRHKHGEYQNVLLSDEDLSKLQAEFPKDWQERIERLSSYLAATGKPYKNHLAVIRNWARRDQEKATAQPVQARPKGVRGFGHERTPDYSDFIKKARE